MKCFFSLFSAVFVLISINLVGCGGGGAEEKPLIVEKTPAPEVKNGVLVDSFVAGINYTTDTLNGVTDSQGSFEYIEGEMITFSVGDIELPSTQAKEVVTLLDLNNTSDTSDYTTINMARFLQSLDADLNPDNGIQITEETHEAATGMFVDFESFTFEFDDAVLSILGEKTSLISSIDAQQHMLSTLEAYGLITSDEPKAVVVPDVPSIGLSIIKTDSFYDGEIAQTTHRQYSRVRASLHEDGYYHFYGELLDKVTDLNEEIDSKQIVASGKNAVYRSLLLDEEYPPILSSKLDSHPQNCDGILSLADEELGHIYKWCDIREDGFEGIYVHIYTLDGDLIWSKRVSSISMKEDYAPLGLTRTGVIIFKDGYIYLAIDGNGDSVRNISKITRANYLLNEEMQDYYHVPKSHHNKSYIMGISSNNELLLGLHSNGVTVLNNEGIAAHQFESFNFLYNYLEFSHEDLSYSPLSKQGFHIIMDGVDISFHLWGQNSALVDGYRKAIGPFYTLNLKTNWDAIEKLSEQYEASLNVDSDSNAGDGSYNYSPRTIPANHHLTCDEYQVAVQYQAAETYYLQYLDCGRLHPNDRSCEGYYTGYYLVQVKVAKTVDEGLGGGCLP